MKMNGPGIVAPFLVYDAVPIRAGGRGLGMRIPATRYTPSEPQKPLGTEVRSGA
jgi:hypothetical protein